MVDIEDGSVVWARSHHKEKFWPSVIFRTWEAAKQAGFVLDGIAFLIEAGRKIDVTDDEASPREGEVLNLYLGENPEWQFVPEDESYILPFMQHREKMRKQRLGGQLKHQFAPALATADRMCGASGQEPSTPGSSSGGGGGGGGGGSSAARPSVANPSPKQRTGVLLDFGTGTSFASFAELWHYLLHNGWATVPGKGLASWYYYPPGSDPKMRNPVLNRNFFDSEDAVIDHVRRTGLERPAPVRTVIPRSNSAAKAKTGTPKSRVSDARPPFAGSPVPAPSISPDGTTPRASKPSAAASGTAATAAAAAATPSTAAAAAAAVAAANTVATPPSSRSPEPMSSPDLVVSAVNSHANSNNKGSSSKTVDNSSSGSSKRVNSSKCKGGGSSSKRNKGTATPLRLDGKGGGGGKGGSTAPVGFPATSVGLLPGFSGVSGGKKAIVGGYSGVGGGGDWDETRDVSSDDLEFVDIGEEDVRLTLETEGIRGGGDGDGKGCDAAVEAVSVAKTQRGAQERTGWPAASRVSIASRRSHGRSMQVEATHVSSSGRGAAPNLAEAVMRQAVTARRLASSPPAPSPSKRPKRAGPQLPPRELARLADKQLAHLRGLLSGAEEPYPTHCGLEGPVSELVRFVTKAYAAWKGRRAGSRASSQAVAESRARGVGAIVLAGPGGTGKSTAFQAAAREFSKRASVKASTIRFVTIKCDRLGGGSGGGGGDPNEVFAKVLAAVTGKATKMTGDNALEALERLTEPSPFLVVFCLEDGGNSLDPSVLQRLLDMAYRQEILFALVCMGTSIDRGMEIGFEQGNLGRHCPMVPMMPCAEDRLRAILGQTLGASGAQDKDGEMIATLVNKGALDVIAKTVARVCGSVRIALNVCEVALVDRLRELGQEDSTTSQAGTSSPATAASACWASSLHGGGSGGAAMCSESASPKGSGGGAAGVLLTVAGAKAALNSYLQTHLVMSAGAVAVEAGGGGGAAVSQPGDGATG